MANTKGKRPNLVVIHQAMIDLDIGPTELARRLGLAGRSSVTNAMRAPGWSRDRARRWARVLKVKVDDILLEG